MRAALAVCLLAMALLVRAEDFQPATILDAGTHYEKNGAVANGFGGITATDANVSVIVLQLGTLKVTAQYQTILHGPRAASNLVVGDTVQAKADGKWIYFIGPTGKQIKAKIMRQERT